MSREPIEPWKTAMRKAGLSSISALARASDVSVETARRLVYGTRAKPNEDTIRKIAGALRESPTTVGKWVGMVLSEEKRPYTPPAEADMLTQRERDAVDEIIRIIVLPRQTLGAARLDNTVLPSAATPDPVTYDDITQAKLAEAHQSDYMPAASPHTQPDPHNDVGE